MAWQGANGRQFLYWFWFVPICIVESSKIPKIFSSNALIHIFPQPNLSNSILEDVSVRPSASAVGALARTLDSAILNVLLYSRQLQDTNLEVI
jgi:hypothetical protein